MNPNDVRNARQAEQMLTQASGVRFAAVQWSETFGQTNSAFMQGGLNIRGPWKWWAPPR